MKKPLPKTEWTGKNVLEAAKDRVRFAYEYFDDVAVSFSGGKDSLVTLELVDRVRKELGIKKKLKVVFRDEELIPDTVIDFVNEHRMSGRFDFYYFCIPLESEKFILGEKRTYVQWDTKRRHLRPIPPYAIVSKKILDQYTCDDFIRDAIGMKGKTGFFTGVRASESIIRFQSVVNNKNIPAIVDVKQSKVMLIRPLYDWQQDDIFKYLYEEGIKYCSIYDMQKWNNEPLRVSTPLHAESAKRFYNMRTRDPQFYEQIVTMFPEMLVQERYWDALDRARIFEQYPYGTKGILQWIEENIPDIAVQNKAKIELLTTLERKKRAEKVNPSNFGGYPYLHIFQQIINGAYKRHIQPTKTPTKNMVEYEKLCGSTI